MQGAGDWYPIYTIFFRMCRVCRVPCASCLIPSYHIAYLCNQKPIKSTFLHIVYITLCIGIHNHIAKNPYVSRVYKLSEYSVYCMQPVCKRQKSLFFPVLKKSRITWFKLKNTYLPLNIFHFLPFPQFFNFFKNRVSSIKGNFLTCQIRGRQPKKPI